MWDSIVIVSVVSFVAGSYIFGLSLLMPSFVTPLVAIIFLKPIHDALKAIAKKLFCLQWGDRNGQSERGEGSDGGGQSDRGVLRVAEAAE